MTSYRCWPIFCLILVAVVILPSLIIGFGSPFWRYADSDLFFSYQAILMNQGLPQDFFDHPGYTQFLFLGGWYRLLHGLGLIGLDRLGALPPAMDRAAFEQAWQDLVMAGRAAAMLLSAALVVGYASGIRRLLHSDRLAVMAGLALAFGVGITTQERQIRNELMAMLFITAALFALLFAARAAGSARRAGLLALAGAGCGLAMITKIQSVFLCLALPVVVLPFGGIPFGVACPRPGRFAGAGTLGLVTLSLAAVAAALGLVADGVVLLGRGQSAYALHPLAGLSGAYQAAIVLWILAGIAAYARVWRVPPAIALRAAAALGMGLSLALLLLALPDPRNLITVANPLESLFMWTDIAQTAGVQTAGAQTAGGQNAVAGVTHLPLAAVLGEILAGIGHTLALRTVVLHPDGVRQTVVFDWIAVAGAVMAWRRGDRRGAARIGVLLLAAWGFESLSGLRGFKRSYVIYSDPLIVLAAALAVAQWRGPWGRLWTHPRGRRLLAAGTVAYALSGMIWPVISLDRGPGPRAMCAWQSTYMRRVEPFPICAQIGP